MKYILEKAKELPVYATTDVLVIGGGVAGAAAALAAARNGSKAMVVERYGWLGGLATGGMVTVIEPYCNGAGKQLIGGIGYEFAERLNNATGAPRGLMPEKEVINSDKQEDIDKWRSWASVGWNDQRVRMVENIHPEYAKHELNQMLVEAGVEILLHTWVVEAVMEGERIAGVIVENKEGRSVIMAKTVVDATGDGDLLKWANIPFTTDTRGTGLVYWVGNVDIDKALAAMKEDPVKFNEIMRAPHRSLYFMRTMVDGVVWFNNWFGKFDELNVAELTKAEIDYRKLIVESIEHYRANLPGFENAQLVKVAPQLGIRLSRILTGRKQVTKESIYDHTHFDDVVALAGLDTKNDIYFEIPYGALLPQRVDNLIAAGRFVSCDYYAQEYVRLIPCCLVTGEAAGTAAALAAQKNVAFADLDVGELQACLRAQGAILS